MMEWTQELDLEEQDLMLANIIYFLMDGKEREAAEALLSCKTTISAWMEENLDFGALARGDHHVEIRAPRAAYDALTTEDNPVRSAIMRAFKAVLENPDIKVKSLTFDSLTENWKEQFQQELIIGGKPTNQALLAEKSKYYTEWQGLRFRSKSETRIAEALDKRAALYFPNCMARLGKPTERRNVEADFLVFHDGRYGILEVDGEAFHQVAAKDHDRDRLFKEYGIVIVERFTADECFKSPEEVVTRFLRLLKKV